MKQIVTTIKRGEGFIGQVINDSENTRAPYAVRVLLGKEVVNDEHEYYDEDEAVSRLDQFMYEVWNERVKGVKNAPTI